MQRADAERVFSLVAEIGGDLRGRIVAERWWLVWIAFGAQMLVTCTLSQRLVWQGEQRLSVWLALWGVHVALLPLIIALIHRRGGGQRTAVETCIWWIWTTKIISGGALSILNQLLGRPVTDTLPILALLSAFAFSMMAMLTHRLFLLCALAFLGVAVAMNLAPDTQFLIFGAAWFAVLVGLGLYFRLTHRPRPSKLL